MAYSYQLFDTEDFYSTHSQPTPTAPTETRSRTSRGSHSSTAKDWSQWSQLSRSGDKYDTLYSRSLELFFYVVLVFLVFGVIAISGMFVAYHLLGSPGRAIETTIPTPRTMVVFKVVTAWPSLRGRTARKTPMDTATTKWARDDTTDMTQPPFTAESFDATSHTLGNFMSTWEKKSTISENNGSTTVYLPEEARTENNGSTTVYLPEEARTEGNDKIPILWTGETSGEHNISSPAQSTEPESNVSSITSPTEPDNNVSSSSLETEQEAENKEEIVWRERLGEETYKARSPAPSNSLICTFGTKINKSTAFPPDGLCSFVFFDSLYINKLNEFGKSLQPNMLYFLRHASKYNKTTYGVGLDFQSGKEVEKFLDGDMAQSTLADYVSKGIHHYGCINTPVVPVSPSEIKGVLKVLQKVDYLISVERRADRPCYTAITASLWSQDWFEAFSQLFKTVFTPDIVIMYGHLFAEDQAWKQCRIVPPTLMVRPKSSPYVYSLKSAHRDMGALQLAGINATLAVSVAMFGRWYEPRYPDLSRPSAPGNFSLYNRCKWTSQDQLGSKTEVCKRLMWHGRVFSNEHQSEYFYDKAAEKTFTFDTATALRAKLCSLKQSLVFLHYSLGAFNLEYADGRDECGEGEFAELRALGQLVEFMNTNFTSARSYEDCVSLSVPASSTPVAPGRRLRRGGRN